MLLSYCDVNFLLWGQYYIAECSVVGACPGEKKGGMIKWENKWDTHLIMSIVRFCDTVDNVNQGEFIFGT